MKKESVKQLQWIKRNIKVLSMCGNAIYLTASAILGIALTMKSVELARSIRGYVAVGGEWFVLLIVLLVSDLIKKFVVFFHTVFVHFCKARDIRDGARSA